MRLAKTTTTTFCALAVVPGTLGLTLKTGDASIGFFRYGPTEDAWRVCRVGLPFVRSVPSAPFYPNPLLSHPLSFFCTHPLPSNHYVNNHPLMREN
jgi:hypothetical protein